MEIATGPAPLHRVAGGRPAPGANSAGRAPASRDAPGLAVFFGAIRKAESTDNDQAVGDDGRSRGPYQIGVAYWRDACEFGGVQWDYLDLVWSRAHCERVMQWYWLRYSPEAAGRLLRGLGGKTVPADAEALYRVHNGGPDGATEPETWPKWLKVKAYLEAVNA